MPGTDNSRSPTLAVRAQAGGLASTSANATDPAASARFNWARSTRTSFARASDTSRRWAERADTTGTSPWDIRRSGGGGSWVEGLGDLAGVADFFNGHEAVVLVEHAFDLGVEVARRDDEGARVRSDRLVLVQACWDAERAVGVCAFADPFAVCDARLGEGLVELFDLLVNRAVEGLVAGCALAADAAVHEGLLWH